MNLRRSCLSVGICSDDTRTGVQGPDSLIVALKAESRKQNQASCSVDVLMSNDFEQCSQAMISGNGVMCKLSTLYSRCCIECQHVLKFMSANGFSE
jgi:hypothetical protein